MHCRSFCDALAFSALGMTGVLPLHAQAPPPLRVAWASIERPNPASPYLEAFRGGMRELGYTEGKDLFIDRRP